MRPSRAAAQQLTDRSAQCKRTPDIKIMHSATAAEIPQRCVPHICYVGGIYVVIKLRLSWGCHGRRVVRGFRERSNYAGSEISAVLANNHTSRRRKFRRSRFLEKAIHSITAVEHVPVGRAVAGTVWRVDAWSWWSRRRPRGLPSTMRGRPAQRSIRCPSSAAQFSARVATSSLTST